MSMLQAQVYEAFRVPDDKALKAAVALSAALTNVEDETTKSFTERDADVEAIRRDVSAITKDVAGINTRLAVLQGDIKADMTTLQSGLGDRMTRLEGDVNGRMTSMQGEINLLKWTMGTVVALLVTVPFRVFTH